MWSEQDTLTGVFMQETSPWDVPLMVTRGFPSDTSVYEAAEAINSLGKPAYLADLAQGDAAIAEGIAGFFGEAFFNLIRILQNSAAKLPPCPEGGGPYIRIDLAETEELAAEERAPSQPPPAGRKKKLAPR